MNPDSIIASHWFYLEKIAEEFCCFLRNFIIKNKNDKNLKEYDEKKEEKYEKSLL